MKPLLFGPAERSLYGVVHEAAGASNQLGAVICHSLPHQYARLRFVHRSLAGLLAGQACVSLRFDWSGVGDSSGALETVSLLTWIADLHLAVEEMRDLHPVSRVVVIAQGLAASVAAVATARGLAVDHLVLVDPAVRGQEHLRWLARCDRRSEYRPHPRDLLGQALPPALERDLAAIDLLRTQPRCAGKLLLLSTASSPAITTLAGQLLEAGARVEHREAPEAADPAPGALDEMLLSPALPAAVAGFIAEALA